VSEVTLEDRGRALENQFYEKENAEKLSAMKHKLDGQRTKDDLRKASGDAEVQKKLAALGSYTNPMSAAEATAFVHKQQQMWQPVLDEIAKTKK